jgi:hypothetical protein
MGTSVTTSRVSSFINNEPHNHYYNRINFDLRSAHGLTCVSRSLVPALSQEEFWLVEITEPLLEQGIDTTWRARTVVTRTSAGQRRSLGEDLDNAATRYKSHNWTAERFFDWHSISVNQS